MKHQARQVLITTAERHGIPWRQTVQTWKQVDLQPIMAKLTNPAVTYPSYYQVPFHAYPEGNLCWLAAFEAEAATHAMALRIWPQENLTWQVAQDRLRSSFHQILGEAITQPVHDILDLGCSVGLSTLSLHRYFAQTQGHSVRTVGLDLSPYMLAVAQHRDVNQDVAAWRHAQAEDTGLPDASFDLVTLQFLVHELPGQATTKILQEVWRLLRPGGHIGIVDNNPKSPVIQNLPPVLFTLMKSTEPWSDEYYTFDLEEALTKIGFAYLQTVASDPRHRTLVARKP
ncbi:methyltransferase domain-containing protein [Synechococcales cyanobacterium C]|uniref:Methyltransferase domain-containing protein n=2 Tax=Petrachloros TaxID=2918834 RepID=A0A8K2A9S5_9CYAN|nr:methyltransferase domain-containing protein [Petrachloros mirabilis ULC683]